MSYLAIARKWRPQRFDEIVGQAHITRTLQNAIRLDRVHHAFLFTGARGVGKTTAARILAKALNCEKGPAPEPCNACPSCLGITNGTSSDVQEIDAASNTGVDNIRDLREKLRYLPSSSRQRIYIIDEIHMLSEKAFNALLKTLEEPPPHVLFIFATTDPQKLPDTILSRCQRFDFKRIPVKLLTEKLGEIATHEGIEITESALLMLAREAEGSMRDAESLLDQVMSATADRVDENLVAEVLGLFDRRFLFDCVEGLLSGDADKSIQIVDQVHTFGFDLKPFTRDLLEIVRHLNVIKVTANPARLMDVSAEEFERLAQLARQSSQDVLSRQFALLLQGYDEVTRSQAPRLALEMTLLKMARVQPTQPLDQLLARLNNFERALRRSGLAAARRIPRADSSGRGQDVPTTSLPPPGEPAAGRGQPAPASAITNRAGGGAPGRAGRLEGPAAGVAGSGAKTTAAHPSVSAPEAARPSTPTQSAVSESVAEGEAHAAEGGAPPEGVTSGSGDKSWHGFMEYWARSSESPPIFLKRARIVQEAPGKVVLGVVRKFELTNTNNELRKPKTQALLQRYYGGKTIVTCQPVSGDNSAAPSYQEIIEQRAQAHKQQVLEKLRANDVVRAATSIFAVEDQAMDVQIDSS